MLPPVEPGGPCPHPREANYFAPNPSFEFFTIATRGSASPSPPPTPPPYIEPVANHDLPFLGMVYLTVLGLSDSVLPYISTWAPTLQLLSYLVKVALVLAFFTRQDPAV